MLTVAIDGALVVLGGLTVVVYAATFLTLLGRRPAWMNKLDRPLLAAWAVVKAAIAWPYRRMFPLT